MRRKHLCAGLIAVALVAAATAWTLTRTRAEQADPQAKPSKTVPLPVAQVILFNSGVGYFERQGEISGDTRVELSFPTSDVNDLLKSLVLQDTAGGRVEAISYDSQDPVDKILRSFALDLNNNPTFGQILNQARGEKIEVQHQEKPGANPQKLSGTIVGMETHRQVVNKDTAVNAEQLNLLTSEGMLSIPLAQVLSVRFQNPTLESEFKRALQVLAGSHDVQKKNVALQFAGNGKRTVKVGYVVERPIWKTTYRLVLEPGGKLFMQGWAIVENTSDDDWNNVRMVLVSGKPISYRMDLYQPLYIPRPLVEPELFASLRPPVYGGSFAGEIAAKKRVEGAVDKTVGNKVANIRTLPPGLRSVGIAVPSSEIAGGFASMAGAHVDIVWTPSTRNAKETFSTVLLEDVVVLSADNTDQHVGGALPASVVNVALRPEDAVTLAIAMENGSVRLVLRNSDDQSASKAKEDADRFLRQLQDSPFAKNADFGRIDLDKLRRAMGGWAKPPEDYRELVKIQAEFSKLPAAEQESIRTYFKELNLEPGRATTARMMATTKDGALAFDEMLDRKLQLKKDKQDGKQVGSMIAGLNYKEGIQSIASSGEIGDYYQYIIDQKISVARQKSAMLPILNQTVEGTKVSIFNEAVHAKFPLLGIRLKNSSGKPLTQGPITVYDDGSYAGDTRTLDLQPNEERLLSYAIDQGTEVKTEVKTHPAPAMTFNIGGNNLTAVYTMRQTKSYTIKNRGTHDRTLVIEHPIRDDWKLIDTQKPTDQSRDVYRFQIEVKASKTVTQEVIEEQTRTDPVALQRGGDTAPRYAVISGIEVKPSIKAERGKLLALSINKGVLEATYKDRESKTYFIQNQSEHDHNFTVDHIVRKDWKRLATDGKDQTGPAVYQFKVDVKSKGTAHQEVIEEHVYQDRSTFVAKIDEGELRKLIAHPSPTAKVKAALQQVLDRQAGLKGQSVELADKKADLKLLAEDQARVRDNLKIIPQTSEHYQDFLKKFVAQEGQIEEMQRAIRTQEAQVQKLQKEYEVFVNGLTVQQHQQGLLAHWSNGLAARDWRGRAAGRRVRSLSARGHILHRQLQHHG